MILFSVILKQVQLDETKYFQSAFLLVYQLSKTEDLNSASSTISYQSQNDISHQILPRGQKLR
jgi:hypothetical protein